ncbi:hypothetical protein ACTFIW_002827 [Dictyostelium discoideum]
MNSIIQRSSALFFKLWRNIVIRKNIFKYLKLAIHFSGYYYCDNWKQLVYHQEKQLRDQVFCGEKIITPELTIINANVLRLYKENSLVGHKTRELNEIEIRSLLEEKHEIIKNLPYKPNNPNNPNNPYFSNNNNNNNPNNNNDPNNNNNKEKIGFFMTISNKLKSNKKEEMINSIKGQGKFRPSFENDRKYFDRKFGKGRSFFLYYCQYKSDDRFAENFYEFTEIGVSYNVYDCKGHGPLYYLIQNENEWVSTRLLDFMVSRKLIHLNAYMLPKLIYYCSVFDRNQLLKLMVLLCIEVNNLDYGLADYSASTGPKTVLASAIQTFKDALSLCIPDEYRGESLKSEMSRHLKLIIIQFLFGNSSEKTLLSILDAFSLSNTPYHPKVVINCWDKIRKFYFYSNFKADDYKTKYGLTRTKIMTIDAVEVVEESRIYEHRGLIWSQYGTDSNQTLIRGRYLDQDVELMTFTVCLPSSVPKIYEAIANYRLDNLKHELLGYYMYKDCFTLVLKKRKNFKYLY